MKLLLNVNAIIRGICAKGIASRHISELRSPIINIVVVAVRGEEWRRWRVLILSDDLFKCCPMWSRSLPTCRVMPPCDCQVEPAQRTLQYSREMKDFCQFLTSSFRIVASEEAMSVSEPAPSSDAIERESAFSTAATRV